MATLALVLLGTAAAFHLARPGSAFACSVDANYDPVAQSPVVVLGTIVSVSDEVPEPLGDQLLLHTVEIDVQQALKGQPGATRVTALMNLTSPGVPPACDEPDISEIQGRTAVIALDESQFDGLFTTGRLQIWFTDEPRDAFVGRERLAELLDAEAQPSDGPQDDRGPILPPDAGTGLVGRAGLAPTLALGALVAVVAWAAALLLARRSITSSWRS